MKLKQLFLIFLPGILSAQNFPYQRDWGTYYGGLDSQIGAIYEDQPDHSVLVDGFTAYPSIGPAPAPEYYNQFITSGGQPFIPSSTQPFSNNFRGRFSASGALLHAGYSLFTQYSYRDPSGNRYSIEKDITNPALPIGVWLSGNVTNQDRILSKYDENNNLLWRTYIPGSESPLLTFDSSGNIYMAGTTSWQNLGDSGTFQEDFETVTDPTGFVKPNSYIVKLNPQGQKIWATYTPSKVISCLAIYEDNLYIAGLDDLNTSASTLATEGAFQATKSNQFISKINGSTGQRIWGTYYGIPNSSASLILYLKTTSTGIYMTGTTFSPVNSTYFATPGAYKASTTDGFDLFLSKFDDDGKQVWSTYLGTDEYEWIIGSRSFDVKDDKIIVTGISQGQIASPGAFLSTKPNPGNTDVFFSMFNTSGNHISTSYYGGPSIYSIGANSHLSAQFSEYSDAFYLFGTTDTQTGFASANAHQQNMIYPSGIAKGQAGFLAKFSSTVLSTTEASTGKDLALYNNPNNGNFSLRGSDLEKSFYTIHITDMSGRLIYSAPTSKKPEEHLSLADKLESGAYILSVNKTDKTVLKTFKLIIKK
ncbi:MAG: T9SS type A sorting domain-containing protein [Chryseobacterium sp.]|jgi:hypothetical protein|uniref:T9SS type A sorting domain-containing protein n=1 Tax=Chryseobacterium sp. TaxID=1871047 RepID=UPI00283A8284|nr:T9SS type A sorting domain-containing protein [Chryseobacterium sp.]MDR2234797.1 T9SS type A sorting domain-containing protein [Chryseobacterium sp.]